MVLRRYLAISSNVHVQAQSNRAYNVFNCAVLIVFLGILLLFFFYFESGREIDIVAVADL
jgi:hypothetical protein